MGKEVNVRHEFRKVSSFVFKTHPAYKKKHIVKSACERSMTNIVDKAKSLYLKSNPNFYKSKFQNLK